MTCREGRGSMFIAKSNEEKRSMAWRIVISIASVLIILIGAFFLFKMFTGNPLEGTWKSTERQLVLTIRGNGTLLVDWEEIFEDEKMTIGMEYLLDKDSKTVTFKADEEALQEAEEKSDGKYTADMLETALSEITATYDYSVQNNQLTLTEREYGEQLVFDKK